MRPAWDTSPVLPLHARSPDVGSTVSHYRILERIAAGGMGVVYKARDLKLDRCVALKILDPEKAADPGRQRRFLQEAQAASALNHPGIVTVYDVDVVDGRQIIAMELLDGATLRDRIADWPLSIEEVLDVGRQIADALEAAHRKGILHRDIKPSNILVTDAGQAKVLDFGLAKPLVPAPDPEAPHQTRPSPLTVDGATVGTLGYMSPEQARGDPLDARSDLFSFGAVLFEMTTGRPAFDGETPAVVYDRLLHHEPDPVVELNPDAPLGLAAVIARALRKDPAERYATAAEIRDDLRQLQLGFEPKAAPPLHPPRRSTSRRVAWLAACVVVLVAASFGIARWINDRTISSIAVLPLENLSGDPANGYFADGMTEALITDLGKVQGLRVTARHSVMRFRDSQAPLAEIAAELHVDALLTGSVTLAGDRMAVTLQLVEPRLERTIWSDRFERGLRDVLAVQGEIAAAVASRVKGSLAPEEIARLTSAAEVRPDAYRLYLEARHDYDRMTAESATKSVERLERAIALDPSFALAHAALADALDLQTELGALPVSVNAPRQARAVERALALAPDSAEAHAAAGSFLFSYRWDLAGAEAEYRRALEINPGHLLSRVFLAQTLTADGRHDEALAETLRARDLDPMNPFVQSNLLLRMDRAGQPARALEEAARLRATFPELFDRYWIFHWGIGLVLYRSGSPVAAAVSFQKAVDVSGGVLEPLPDLAASLARAGRVEDARRILELLEAESARRHVPAYHFGTVHAALGDEDRAFAFYEAALAERDWRLLGLAVGTSAATLRGDPRWESLLNRVGIRDVVVAPKGRGG